MIPSDFPWVDVSKHLCTPDEIMVAAQRMDSAQVCLKEAVGLLEDTYRYISKGLL